MYVGREGEGERGREREREGGRERGRGKKKEEIERVEKREGGEPLYNYPSLWFDVSLHLA